VAENYTQRGLVGIIGHELGHVLDYTTQTDREILWTGVRYVTSKRYKQEMECWTDEITIQRGLGADLYEAVLTQHSIPTYWEHKAGIYYTPEELLLLMN
jgi:hypothetical protein